ncbi:hypothetical protein [Ferrithrix thermotolerans]|uniref:hypothetical protein n=1 Tax=Ferrithrix thermotolerans TaxID=209649 RepID=UPI001160921C|nr:hypothetical protein [Ferrithrix thermotolerans]
MPWCENCSKFKESEEIDKEGHCPTCGSVIAPPKKAPWHFKLLVVATVIYLTYRFVQLSVWLYHHL